MSNETIFREVDEELRGDRLRAIWRRFGPYLIGAAVAIVLLVAINEGWNWWQNSQAAAASDKFYAALEIADGGDLAAAQQAFADVEAGSPAGYATLARFRQAGLLAKQGKTDEAVAAYDALATSESNQHIKSLALVFAANLFVDKGDVAAVQQRVQGLAVDGNPMRNAARETIGLAQYRAGDLDGAVATLSQIIADPMTNREMVGRIQLYVAQLIAMGATPPGTAEAAADAIDAEVSGTEEPAAEPSVGDAPAMDVTEPAPATDAAPVETTAPATDAAPAAGTAPATDAAAPATTTEGTAAGN